MAQELPGGYVFDPADPRAPTEDQWAGMAPAERARVVAMLPAEVPWELMPPEGDAHREAKERATGIKEKIRATQEQILAAQERLLAAQERLLAAQERLLAAQQKLRAAEEQARAAQERAEIAAKHSADLERQLREAQAEIARLKGGGSGGTA